MRYFQTGSMNYTSSLPPISGLPEADKRIAEEDMVSLLLTNRESGPGKSVYISGKKLNEGKTVTISGQVLPLSRKLTLPLILPFFPGKKKNSSPSRRSKFRHPGRQCLRKMNNDPTTKYRRRSRCEAPMVPMRWKGAEEEVSFEDSMQGRNNVG